jgi:predicted nucleotide-binding protein
MIVGIAGKIHDKADRDWPFTAGPEEFKDLCVHLGERLGHHGHRLVVRSSSESTADRNVVEGYLQAFEHPDATRRDDLRVFVTGRPPNEPHAYRDFEKRYPGLFAPLPSRTPRPRSDHLIACTRCHATICLGGGERTEQIGHAVLAARRHLIPVAGCGGASRALYDFVTQATRDAAFLPHQIGNDTLLQSLPAPQLREQIDRWLTDTASGPTVVIIHGHDSEAVERLKEVLHERCRLPERNVRLMIDGAPSAITFTEKWECIAREATAAIVVATPDDEGGVRTERDRPKAVRMRARQNVWLEFGWMWSFLRQRDRLLVLTRAAEHGDLIEAPSDVDAVKPVVFDNTLDEVADKIEAFIDAVRLLDRRFPDLG